MSAFWGPERGWLENRPFSREAGAIPFGPIKSLSKKKQDKMPPALSTLIFGCRSFCFVLYGLVGFFLLIYRFLISIFRLPPILTFHLWGNPRGHSVAGKVFYTYKGSQRPGRRSTHQLLFSLCGSRNPFFIWNISKHNAPLFKWTDPECNKGF